MVRRIPDASLARGTRVSLGMWPTFNTRAATGDFRGRPSPNRRDDQLSTRRSISSDALSNVFPGGHLMMVARSLVGLSLYLWLVSSAGVPVHAQSRTALQLPPPVEAVQAPVTVVSPAPAPAVAAPPTPVAFETALLKAAEELLSKAQLDDATDKVDVVIDPLIDGVTGAQSSATHQEEKRIVELIKTSYPRFRVLPFSAKSIAR